MRFGCHVSIRHGYLGAAKMAVQLGAETFQYFPKNPRGLGVKAFDRNDAEACARFCREHGLKSIAHTSYPVNLAAEDPELRAITVKSVLNDLDIANACGSIGLVVHFGKVKNVKDPLQGYKNIIQLLNTILSRWTGEALILLENQAGDGSKMGMFLEELTNIRGLTEQPDKIGFCFDTCHAFACGLWSGGNWRDLEERGAELGYFEALKAIHLNDSAYPTLAFKDRHAPIGKGYIGEQAFRELLQSPNVRHIPLILETPAVAGFSHTEQLELLRSWSAST